jgi:hypothetical protein
MGSRQWEKAEGKGPRRGNASSEPKVTFLSSGSFINSINPVNAINLPLCTSNPTLYLLSHNCN